MRTFSGLRFLSLSSRYYSTPPLQIAIVGAGPAGFYTAHRLLKKNKDLKITLFEKRICPFGLVRYGVAPDHPEVKNCIHTFSEVGRSSRVQYYGNIEFGKDFNLTELEENFHAVVFCLGAPSERTVTIPGEDKVKNVFSAHQVVGWYNGMPEHVQLPIDLEASDTATIFGHGNVALDITRILLSPMDVLKKTDISKIALSQLEKSRIRHVHLIGRRGPFQVSFTSAEFRELLKLPDCTYITDRTLFSSLPTPSTRPLQRLLHLMSSMSPQKEPPTLKSFHLTFFRVPTFLGPDHQLELTHTQLHNENVTLTTQRSILNSGLCIKSFGYSTWPDSFLHQLTQPKTGSTSLPVYVTGWMYTQGKGTLATTMHHAYQTAESLLLDLETRVHEKASAVLSKHCRGVTRDEVASWNPTSSVMIDWGAWTRIDQVEKEKQTKFLSNEEMIQCITSC